MSTFKGFSTVSLQRPKQSSFDLTHDRRMNLYAGVLTPILIKECVPSERVRGSSEILLRLAPLLAPIYDQITLYVHYFFVPNRLLWDEWETFITGGRLGVGIDPVEAPIPPRVDIGALYGLNPDWRPNGGLADNIGLPDFLSLDPDPADWEGKYFDAMPFGAYNLVWSEYYRDRNFVSDDAMPTNMFPMASGDQDPGDFENMLGQRRRAYRPDYFTSALPFTQRGEEVLMPIALGGVAPLYYERIAAETGVKTLESTSGTAYGALDSGTSSVPGLPAGSQLFVQGEDFDGTSTSINDFRSAYALQVWLERNAVGGSRYTESTQAHFGVRPQDSRLQRPEYIGGGRIQVKISEVLSTAWAKDADDNDVPQANMAGHGITYGNTNQFRYFCAEHGFVIGIASILTPSSYQQGLPRMFRRKTFLDYPWPTFAKLGEQPVYDYELYCTPASLTPDADGEEPVFGYQSRYADWKWLPTTNHGDFKTSLLFWTATRTFNTPPVLSDDFVRYQPAVVDRMFAVQDPINNAGTFWAYIHNKIHSVLPLPYFGTPNTLNFV